MKARDAFDTASARALAVKAGVDPRSLDRVVEGKPTRPSVRLRVLAALLDCGIDPASLTPNEPSQTAP